MPKAMGIRDNNTCTICGRIEPASRSCMGQQFKCSSCMDAMVSRHQLSFAKLHITKHKLPHFLATHVYQYLHGKATHRHAKSRIMFARFLQGKVETPSSLAALHHALAAPIIELACLATERICSPGSRTWSLDQTPGKSGPGVPGAMALDVTKVALACRQNVRRLRVQALVL